MPSGGSHGHWTCFCLLHRLTPRKYATSPCLRVHASPLEGKPGMLLLQVMEALYSVSYSSSKRNLASCLVDLTVLPWKSTASLNELHPSLLSVSCVVYMIITAAVSVLLQHLLLFSFFFLTNILVIPAVPPGQAQEHKLSVPHSPTDKTVCKIIVSC